MINSPLNRKEFENSTNKLNEIKNTLDKSICNNIRNVSLMEGAAGLALFYFYFSKHTKTQDNYNKAYKLIEQIFHSINNGNNYHTFAGGLAGIGWLMEHLEKEEFIDTNTNEILGELDNYIYNAMVLDIKKNNFDYLHGAIGCGIFFLRRLYKNPKIEAYLINLVNDLAKISENDINGIKWGSYLLPGNKGKKCYNLSLSHGMASIIVFLSKTYRLNIQKKKSLLLLEGAIKYLLKNQLDSSKYFSTFPFGIVDSETPSNSRLAWCYGDLGIGMAIYQAGKATGNSQWEKKAIEVLLRTTNRITDKETSVVDAGICHGTAGIAHIYNRIYGYTNIDVFRESSEFWFQKTIEMAKFEDGLAGYKVWRNKESGGDLNEPGFLEGIAGIGLALISAVSDIEPAWDECLLLS